MSAIDERIKQLRSARADYADEAAWHKFLMDAAFGTGGFRGRVGPTAVSLLGWAAEAYAEISAIVAGTMTPSETRETYLDQFSREDEKKFSQRINVAHYTNYVGPIHELLMSYVNKADMNRDDVPARTSEWMEDVDGRGTPWDVLHCNVVRPRASLLGWCPVLFDMRGEPDAGGEVSIARAREIGRVPRAIPLYPINVLDWIASDDGEITAAKIRTDHWVRADFFGPKVKQERYALWTRTDVRRITVEVRENEPPVIVSDEAHPHGFGRVPLVVFRANPTPDDRIRGVSTIGNSAVAARRLFNLESEMDDHIRGQVFAVMGVPVEDTATVVGEIVGGNGNGIKVPMQSRLGVHFAAPPASVAETLEKRMEVMVREIYRTENIEHTKPTGMTAASGVARAYEFEKTNRRLAGISSSFARCEQEALRLVAEMLSENGEQATVTAPTDFSVEDLNAEIEAVLAALDVLGVTAGIELRRRLVRRMLPNLPTAIQHEIESELEDMASQLESDRALEREMNQAKMRGEDDSTPGNGTLNEGANGGAGSEAAA